MAQGRVLHRIATLTLAGSLLGFSLGSALAQDSGTSDAPAPGDTYDTEGVKGFKAYESGDYATALRSSCRLLRRGRSRPRPPSARCISRARVSRPIQRKP
jgi:hypothetical protein